MAVILKATYENETRGLFEPTVYVDSINKDSYMAEIYNQTVRYIREHTPVINGRIAEIRRENHKVRDEKAIGSKPDGYWFVSDEKNKTLTLYKKTTKVGYIYSSVYITKVYEMKCSECPRIVPQISAKKTSLFDNFSTELSERVVAFRERTDALN